MLMEEARDLDDHDLTASFIIELLNLCTTVKELQLFYEEVDLAFISDEKNEQFTKFEKTVVYEHFFKRFDILTNKNKKE